MAANDERPDPDTPVSETSPVLSEEPTAEQAAAAQLLLGIGRKDTLRAICGALIIVAMAIGFAKIVGVDSVKDRTIQEYRLAQLPAQLNDRMTKLQQRNLSPERFEEEARRIKAALLTDALKARPTLSANDRSRWDTIRALVEKESRVYRYVPIMTESQRDARVSQLVNEQLLADPNVVPDTTFRYYASEILVNCASECPERFSKQNMKAKRYAKSLVPYAIDKTWETPGWESIDVVKHGLADEVWEPDNPSSGYLYSSKPPLLPTVMAAPYWVLYNVFGLSLRENPFLTVRILLVLYNLIPLGIAFCCLARVIDILARTDWSKIFVLATALFGFFSLTFVATLNNHVPGFVCISISLWATCEILCLGKNDYFRFICAGFFGAFAVVCELPALLFAVLLCLTLLIKRPRRTLGAAIPAGLVVVAAFLATNYIAHGSPIPAYAHKRDHIAMQNLLAAEAQEEQATVEDAEIAGVELLFDPNDWYYYVYYPAGRPRVPSNAIVSHWANRTGIDRGEPSIPRYIFHSTIGLRGVFSLTPVWILALIGVFMWLFEKDRGLPVGTLAARDSDCEAYSERMEARLNFTKAISFMALLLAVVFFVFFMTRDQGDRNYGGVACCLRWFFPLAPLFIPCLIPALEWLAVRRWGRYVAYFCLFWSVVSVFYPTWNPWVSPWLYQLAVEGELFTPY